ncbi:hypothetical protein [Luteolibacter luteus]|uniref:Uncharacterized protein n=1 Tax=Luteolibacter luteus TaxID=2728835 RepID=A0A858RQ72_9BACT|nr:hypothetical protein [Luteolibacter luteus]QJE99032.1 hypothetical protein HHL09_25715 [Luteolibacter luteus]
MELNWPYEPSNWSSFLGECAWYLVPGLALHLVLLVPSLPVFWFLLRPLRASGRWLKVALVFHATLLVAGMLANGLWSCVIRGRLYWSTDYISDFSAFYPISQGVIDFRFGDQAGALNGISLAYLNGIWMVFALGVWVTAFLVSGFYVGRREVLFFEFEQRGRMRFTGER